MAEEADEPPDDSFLDALTDHAARTSALFAHWSEIVASSRCVHCGRPILKERRSLFGSGWLHPIEIDKPPNKQRWAVHCYQAPVAEPEPGWEYL